MKEIVEIVGKIKEELENVEKRRDVLIKESRSVLLYTRRAISSIHAGKSEEATEYIEKAEVLLSRLRKVAGEDLKRHIYVAEGEFVEAVCLKRINEGGPLPRPQELGVQLGSYLHGLLDCVGELRRCILDALREEKFDKAVHLFKGMEAIYSTLLPLSVYDSVVQGLRHKIDVVRIQVEETRGLLAEEALLRRLMDKLSKLEQDKE